MFHSFTSWHRDIDLKLWPLHSRWGQWIFSIFVMRKPRWRILHSLGDSAPCFFWGGVVGWVGWFQESFLLHFSVFFLVGWLNVLGWEIEKLMVELRTIIAKPERLGEFLMWMKVDGNLPPCQHDSAAEFHCKLLVLARDWIYRGQINQVAKYCMNPCW